MNEQPEQICAAHGSAAFVDMPIGARFRLPAGRGYVGGIYVKTSPVSYGKRAGEALWDITGKPFQVELLNSKLSDGGQKTL